MRGISGRDIFCLALMCLALPMHAAAQPWECSRAPLCSQMSSCAEADFYFRQCGHTDRDGDGDGIPCENLCGDTMEIYLLRRSDGAASPLLQSVRPVGGDFSCEPRKTCGEMASCEEAYFHLDVCGRQALDGNRDGVPCESICR